MNLLHKSTIHRYLVLYFVIGEVMELFTIHRQNTTKEICAITYIYDNQLSKQMLYY
jgi:hypothetical protein